MNKTLCHCCNTCVCQKVAGRTLAQILTPKNHNRAQPCARCDLLQNNVARHLEEDIRDEEDEQRDVVLFTLEPEAFFKTLDFRIPDVGAVEEGEEEEDEERRDNVEVALPLEFLQGSGVHGREVGVGVEVPDRELRMLLLRDPRLLDIGCADLGRGFDGHLDGVTRYSMYE